MWPLSDRPKVQSKPPSSYNYLLKKFCINNLFQFFYCGHFWSWPLLEWSQIQSLSSCTLPISSCFSIYLHQSEPKYNPNLGLRMINIPTKYKVSFWLFIDRLSYCSKAVYFVVVSYDHDLDWSDPKHNPKLYMVYLHTKFHSDYLYS